MQLSSQSITKASIAQCHDAYPDKIDLTYRLLRMMLVL
jgi:hypothetical protein